MEEDFPYAELKVQGNACDTKLTLEQVQGINRAAYPLWQLGRMLHDERMARMLHDERMALPPTPPRSQPEEEDFGARDMHMAVPPAQDQPVGTFPTALITPPELLVQFADAGAPVDGFNANGGLEGTMTIDPQLVDMRQPGNNIDNLFLGMPQLPDAVDFGAYQENAGGVQENAGGVQENDVNDNEWQALFDWAKYQQG